ncbi:MAG: hypothetical protein V4850_12240 [Myxococcota bacterium]
MRTTFDEGRYDEALVLMARSPVAALGKTLDLTYEHAAETAWLPKPVLVDVATWTVAKTQGVAKGGVQAVPTPKIDALADVVRYRADVAVPDASVAAGALEGYRAALARVLEGLDEYKPLTTANEPHRSMLGFKNELGDMVLAELKLATARKAAVAQLHAG